MVGVGDDVPTVGGRVGRGDGPEVNQEVGLNAGRPRVGGDEPAGGDVAA